MRKILPSLLLVLVLTSCLAVSGSAEVWKDEVVYARLSPSGEAGEVYVVNSFETDGEVKVVDYGRYTGVLSLGDAEGFTYGEGAASFAMKAGRFHYQGTMEEARLPWEFVFEFALDGQALNPEELSGAQGHLEIRLSIKPVETLRTYTDSLSLQVTLTLDGDRCLNIASERATQAISGGSRTLSFIIMPGQGAEYLVTADVHDFSMAGIQVAGIRMGMDTAMYQEAARQALEGSPLEAAVGGFMGNFISGMQGSPVVSFADSRNAVRSLQFVLMGEGVKARTVQEAAEEEPPAESVWDRFLNLFGLE